MPIHKTRDGLSIYYEIHAVGNSGTDLVLLNGLTQSTAAWLPVLRQLKGVRRVLLMDFINQGASEKTGKYRSFGAHAEDVHELVGTYLKPPVALCGISYGSLAIQEYVLHHRVDKIILISTFARKTALYKTIESSWHAALRQGGYLHFVDIILPWVLGNEFLNTAGMRELIKKQRAENPIDPVNLMALMEATRLNPDHLEALASCTIPALVVQGLNDRLFPVEMAAELAEAMPECTLELIANAGHSLNLEAPTELAQKINAFMAS